MPDWDESKHPRADDGKFGEGGGGAAPQGEKAAKARSVVDKARTTKTAKASAAPEPRTGGAANKARASAGEHAGKLKTMRDELHDAQKAAAKELRSLAHFESDDEDSVETPAEVRSVLDSMTSFREAASSAAGEFARSSSGSDESSDDDPGETYDTAEDDDGPGDIPQIPEMTEAEEAALESDPDDLKPDPEEKPPSTLDAYMEEYHLEGDDPAQSAAAYEQMKQDWAAEGERYKGAVALKKSAIAKDKERIKVVEARGLAMKAKAKVAQAALEDVLDRQLAIADAIRSAGGEHAKLVKQELKGAADDDDDGRDDIENSSVDVADAVAEAKALAKETSAAIKALAKLTKVAAKSRSKSAGGKAKKTAAAADDEEDE